jgi:prenylcysteine oxidase / farnesylcysteine lyase
MKSLAVVGAGTGGCCAAYFASKHLPGIKLTIYDAQGRIGGRILTHKAAGVNLEVGAAFFNGTNKTILGIIKSEQLRTKRIKERISFAVWDGSELIYRSDEKTAITNLKLLSQYKLSIVRTLLLLREAKGQVAKLYREAAKNPVDTAELFESAGLSKWYTKAFDELLLERGVNRTFIDEIATPITRTIYSQNAGIGGFAGISSFIGVYGGPIYSLAEGNSTLPTRIAEASEATVKLGQKVTRIEKTSEGSYKVSAGADAALFDGVIVAAPLEIAGIELDGIAKPNFSSSYQEVYTKVMQGVFNPSYFGLNESAEPPAIVLTTKGADPITHCSIQKIGNNDSLVTFSSTEPIADETFSGIFKSGASPVLQHHWTAAYPKFKPIERLPPTRLSERLFHLNSIEASVSSMETAALSALNAVKMMGNDLP